MITIPIEYDDGKVIIKGKAPHVKGKGKLIIEEGSIHDQKLDLTRFQFKKVRDILKNVEGNISDDIIHERRSEN